MGSAIVPISLQWVLWAKGPAGAERPNVPEIRHEPLPLGSGKKVAFGPDPLLALVLALLVGVVVFALIWRVRRTFGIKD
jgi:hypothetical protein